MKQAGRCHFFSPHLCNFTPPFFELGSTEHPDCFCVYLGQESSFMYMTPRQSRRTERGDEGRWWRTPTHSLWGDALLSSFSPLIPSLYCILIGWLMYHGNSLWMQEAGEVKGKVAAAEKRLKCDVEATRMLLYPELLLTIYWCNRSVWGKWKHYSRYRDLGELPAICLSCLSYCFFLLRLHQHPFIPGLFQQSSPTATRTDTHTSSTNSSPSAPPPSYKQLIFCSTTALMDALRLEASQPRDIHLLACHTPARQKIFVMCTPIFLQ